jgi:hypothetical protein
MANHGGPSGSLPASIVLWDVDMQLWDTVKARDARDPQTGQKMKRHG